MKKFVFAAIAVIVMVSITFCKSKLLNLAIDMSCSPFFIGNPSTFSLISRIAPL